MATKSISDQLDQLLVLLSAVADTPEIQARLAAYGYDAAALAAGRALYDAALAARNTAHAARQHQRRSAGLLAEQRAQIERNYGALAHIARTLWADNRDALERLALVQRYRRVHVVVAAADGDGPPTERTALRRVRGSQSRASFFARAELLYRTALHEPMFRDALAGVGYDADRLQRELADFQAYQHAVVAQIKVGTDSTRCTAAQHAALAAARSWATRCTAIATVALAERPDLLARMRGGRRTKNLEPNGRRI